MLLVVSRSAWWFELGLGHGKIQVEGEAIMKPKSSTSSQSSLWALLLGWQVVPCCIPCPNPNSNPTPSLPAYPFGPTIYHSGFWEVLILSHPLTALRVCPFCYQLLQYFLFNWQTGLSLTFFSLLLAADSNCSDALAAAFSTFISAFQVEAALQLTSLQLFSHTDFGSRWTPWSGGANSTTMGWCEKSTNWSINRKFGLRGFSYPWEPQM